MRRLKLLKQYASLMIAGLTILLVSCRSVVNTKDSTQQVVEIQYSKAESKAMGKWKNKTVEEMIHDAQNGDAAALHMLGMSHVYGLCGLPINMSDANLFLGGAASLGFAPAIDQIKFMQLEENHNPFLALVYLNLLVSFNHHEFVMPYHKLREEMVDKCGQQIIKKIERIASEKHTKILKLMNQMDKTDDKAALTLEILSYRGVTEEDAKYDMQYWETLFEKGAR